MIKEHFLDYESHTVTQPPLKQKLEILDKHLTKSKIVSKNNSNTKANTSMAKQAQANYGTARTQSNSFVNRHQS